MNAAEINLIRVHKGLTPIPESTERAKAARKPKYIIPRDCLDAKGNLKPDSPCAKKMREVKQRDIKP